MSRHSHNKPQLVKEMRETRCIASCPEAPKLAELHCHSKPAVVRSMPCGVKSLLIFALLLSFVKHSIEALVLNAADSPAFPAAWHGDRHNGTVCPTSGDIPPWVDGYLLCQLSASYGRQDEAFGSRLLHMLDGLGAVGAFHIRNGEVRFSAQYYPTRAYKIWDFYGRNVSRSKVAWLSPRSPFNITAMNSWDSIGHDGLPFSPNLGFWKVGKEIIAGGESTSVGLRFDVDTLSHFSPYNFKDPGELFTGRTGIQTVSMPIHATVDADGTIWSTAAAIDPQKQESYQIVFSVNPQGFRTVANVHILGHYSLKACDAEDNYTGDKSVLPSYMHSIASSENYLILPLASSYINPCFNLTNKLRNPNLIIDKNRGLEFTSELPLRFLVMDKRSKTWATAKLLESPPAMFVSRQLNAYEREDGRIIVDMIVYENVDLFEKFLYLDYIRQHLIEPEARILRFIIDVQAGTVQRKGLIPVDKIAADFPAINAKYAQKPYQFAYLLHQPFTPGNAVLKLNVEDATGRGTLVFKAPKEPIILSEPVFVPDPQSFEEDAGVLLIRGLDTASNSSSLYLVNAKSMQPIGEAKAPISIPLGLHSQFFSSAEVGLPLASERRPEVQGNFKINEIPGWQGPGPGSMPGVPPRVESTTSTTTTSTTAATTTSTTTPTTTTPRKGNSAERRGDRRGNSREKEFGKSPVLTPFAVVQSLPQYPGQPQYAQWPWYPPPPMPGAYTPVGPYPPQPPYPPLHPSTGVDQQFPPPNSGYQSQPYLPSWDQYGLFYASQFGMSPDFVSSANSINDANGKNGGDAEKIKNAWENNESSQQAGTKYNPYVAPVYPRGPYVPPAPYPPPPPYPAPQQAGQGYPQPPYLNPSGGILPPPNFSVHPTYGISPYGAPPSFGGYNVQAPNAQGQGQGSLKQNSFSWNNKPPANPQQSNKSDKSLGGTPYSAFASVVNAVQSTKSSASQLPNQPSSVGGSNSRPTVPRSNNPNTNNFWYVPNRFSGSQVSAKPADLSKQPTELQQQPSNFVGQASPDRAPYTGESRSFAGIVNPALPAASHQRSPPPPRNFPSNIYGMNQANKVQQQPLVSVDDSFVAAMNRYNGVKPDFEEDPNGLNNNEVNGAGGGNSFFCTWFGDLLQKAGLNVCSRYHLTLRTYKQ